MKLYESLRNVKPTISREELNKHEEKMNMFRGYFKQFD